MTASFQTTSRKLDQGITHGSTRPTTGLIGVYITTIGQQCKTHNILDITSILTARVTP